MKVVVGLGNPGRRYVGTRHNVGFVVLDELARRHSAAPPHTQFDALVTEFAVDSSKLLLVAPQTFMNASGQSVSRLLSFYHLPLEDLMVVCDDFHLNLGSLRLRRTGSSGGQLGLEDIIHRLGSRDFARLRVGIGPVPGKRDSAEFVLSRFLPSEQEYVDMSVAEAADGVELWATVGADAAMNRVNVRKSD